MANTIPAAELLSLLCQYDPRNPDNSLDIYDEDDRPAAATADCGCDNCFYGRTRLADALLAARGGAA